MVSSIGVPMNTIRSFSRRENNEYTLYFDVYEGLPGSGDGDNAGGGASSRGQSALPDPVNFTDNSRLWFYFLMAAGVIILLSFVWVEYKRRQSM